MQASVLHASHDQLNETQLPVEWSNAIKKMETTIFREINFPLTIIYTYRHWAPSSLYTPLDHLFARNLIYNACTQFINKKLLKSKCNQKFFFSSTFMFIFSMHCIKICFNCFASIFTVMLKSSSLIKHLQLMISMSLNVHFNMI